MATFQMWLEYFGCTLVNKTTLETHLVHFHGFKYPGYELYPCFDQIQDLAFKCT